MNIEYYKPKNKILQKYVDGYYFIQEDKQSGSIEYETFPNNNIYYTINRNTSINEQTDKISLDSSDNNSHVGSLVLSYSKPLRVFYTHLLDEITICFKPLGIFHFDVTNFNSVNKKTLIHYNLFEDITEFSAKLFDLTVNEKAIELEKYLISKLIEVDLSFMENIITDVEDEIKIEDISAKYSISRQYLNRIFKKYLGKSPSEYRKIYRFRNSLLNKKESKNLTELSSTDYYDQSHFIKEFKSITKLKPSQFFKEVEINSQTIFIFFD
ncbi:helix-turn-helix domain-containing protein [Empedobacter sedimenti]|uniref:helix-turn-helix domain-containing protein n=1 Tax=Empedobacter sedimenti TaxID=3042610 RepID=UPI0024A67C3E|nr:helix-turn-helix domain-containing protein [Empedobacter sedimenti]